MFVAFLASQGLSPQSVSVYLAGVRHLAVCAGDKPEDRSQWPRLQYVIRGLARTRANVGPRPRLPITGSILARLGRIWSEGSFQDRLLWAASCVGFFGFLRSGEFTSTVGQPVSGLLVEDVAIDSHECPAVVRIRLRIAKMDPFGKGVDIFLGATGSEVCPVGALLKYLSVRPAGKGPLFVGEDRTPLSRSYYVSHLKMALRRAGIDDSQYSGHSLRIGAATTAAAVGIPDHVIKMLGRWRSEAYHLYIRVPGESLAQFTRRLGSGC